MNLIPARNLQKNYKAIIGGVKENREIVVLTTKSEPQAALVSLEDLENIEHTHNKQAHLAMLKLAKENRKKLNKLPSILRDKADEILYTK